MGGSGGGENEGGGERVTKLPEVCRLEIAKEAAGKLHVLQLPSSHEVSAELQREATSASLPIEALVAVSALAGSPLPCGLPAIDRSKLMTELLPWVRRICSAPSVSTFA